MWIWFEILKIVCYTDNFHGQSLCVIQHVECGEEQGGMLEYVCYMYLFKGVKYKLFCCLTSRVFNLPFRNQMCIDDLSIEIEKYCVQYFFEYKKFII